MCMGTRCRDAPTCAAANKCGQLRNWSAKSGSGSYSSSYRTETPVCMYVYMYERVQMYIRIYVCMYCLLPERRSSDRLFFELKISNYRCSKGDLVHVCMYSIRTFQCLHVYLYTYIIVYKNVWYCMQV